MAADSNGVDLDELYTYYPTNRLATMVRGNLNAAKTGLVSQSEVFSEIWGLDATGNWRLYYRDDAGLGNWDLVQQRTHNEANEIETIGATTGTDWADPTHDRAGNMVTLPKPETTDERSFFGGFTFLVNCRSLEAGLFAYFGGTFGLGVGLLPLNAAVNSGVGYVWSLPTAADYSGEFYMVAAGGGAGALAGLGTAGRASWYFQAFTADLPDYFSGAKTEAYGWELGNKTTFFPVFGVGVGAAYYWTIKTWKLPATHFLIRSLCCPKSALAPPAPAAGAGEVRRAASLLSKEARKHETLIKASAEQEGRKYLREEAAASSGLWSRILTSTAQGPLDADIRWGSLPK